MSPGAGETPGAGVQEQQRYVVEVPAQHANRDTLLALQEILAEHPGQRPVQLIVPFPGGRVVMDVSSRYAVQPSPRLAQQIDALLA